MSSEFSQNDKLKHRVSKHRVSKHRVSKHRVSKTQGIKTQGIKTQGIKTQGIKNTGYQKTSESDDLNQMQKFRPFLHTALNFFFCKYQWHLANLFYFYVFWYLTINKKLLPKTDFLRRNRKLLPEKNCSKN